MEWIPLVLVAVLAWAAAKRHYGVLLWAGVCAMPAVVVYVLLRSGAAWRGADQLLGAMFFAQLVTGGLVVFVCGLAGYGLSAAGARQRRYRVRRPRRKPAPTKAE